MLDQKAEKTTVRVQTGAKYDVCLRYWIGGY